MLPTVDRACYLSYYNHDNLHMYIQRVIFQVILGSIQLTVITTHHTNNSEATKHLSTGSFININNILKVS